MTLSPSRLFAFLVVCLLFTTETCWPVEEQQCYLPLSLSAEIDGENLRFRLENVGSTDLIIRNCLNNGYGWPEDCWLQVRNSHGDIMITSETSDDGYWSPLFYASYANNLPIKLERLQAGQSWESESSLKYCLRAFCAWPRIKSGVKGSEFAVNDIAAVKITVKVRLDSMLVKSKVFETDWIAVSPNDW